MLTCLGVTYSSCLSKCAGVVLIIHLHFHVPSHALIFLSTKVWTVTFCLFSTLCTNQTVASRSALYSQVEGYRKVLCQSTSYNSHIFIVVYLFLQLWETKWKLVQTQMAVAVCHAVTICRSVQLLLFSKHHFFSSFVLRYLCCLVFHGRIAVFVIINIDALLTSLTV